MPNNFCPPDCNYLFPTEEIQERVKNEGERLNDHWCHRYHTRVYHNRFHPNIVKLPYCDYEMPDKVLQEQRYQRKKDMCKMQIERIPEEESGKMRLLEFEVEREEAAHRFHSYLRRIFGVRDTSKIVDWPWED